MPSIQPVLLQPPALDPPAARAPAPAKDVPPRARATTARDRAEDAPFERALRRHADGAGAAGAPDPRVDEPEPPSAEPAASTAEPSSGSDPEPAPSDPTEAATDPTAESALASEAVGEGASSHTASTDAPIAGASQSAPVAPPGPPALAPGDALRATSGVRSDASAAPSTDALRLALEPTLPAPQRPNGDSTSAHTSKPPHPLTDPAIASDPIDPLFGAESADRDSITGDASGGDAPPRDPHAALRSSLHPAPGAHDGATPAPAPAGATPADPAPLLQFVTDDSSAAPYAPPVQRTDASLAPAAQSPTSAQVGSGASPAQSLREPAQASSPTSSAAPSNTASRTDSPSSLSAPATTPADSAAPRPEQADFTAFLARGVGAVVRQGGGSLTLRLDPPSLGQLTIRLTIESGAVQARFESSTTQARQLLTDHMSTLRATLEARGLNVERLEVAARSAGVAHAAPSHPPAEPGAAASVSSRADTDHDASQGHNRGARDHRSETGRRHEQPQHDGRGAPGDESPAFSRRLRLSLNAIA